MSTSYKQSSPKLSNIISDYLITSSEAIQKIQEKRFCTYDIDGQRWRQNNLLRVADNLFILALCFKIRLNRISELPWKMAASLTALDDLGISAPNAELKNIRLGITT